MPQAGAVEVLRQDVEKRLAELGLRLTAVASALDNIDVGGGGAPVGASYVVMAANGTLTDERVLTAGNGINVVDGGAGGPVTVSASSEFIRDTIGTALVEGHGVDIAVDDPGDTITIAVDESELTAAAIGGFTEAAQDAAAAMIVDGNGIDTVYNDVANTLTITVDETELVAASIGGFAEAVDDRVAALCVAGTNMTITYNDVAGTLTFDSAGGAGYTDEQAQDAVGTILTDSTTINFTYNDVANTITAAVFNASIDTAHLVDNCITNAKFRDCSALSVFGRNANSVGDGNDIVAGTNGHVLRRSTSPSLEFGTLLAGGFATGPGIVTPAMLDNGTACSVLGRSANSAGARADIAAASDGQVLMRSGGVVAFATLPAANVSDAVRILDRSVSDTTVSSTTSPTSIYSYTLPANTCSNGSVLRIRIFSSLLNSTGSIRTFDVAITFGGVTLWADTTAGLASSANRRACSIELYLSVQDTTNLQVLDGYFSISNVVLPNTGQAGDINGGANNDLVSSTMYGVVSTLNLNVNRTLDVTVDPSFSSATLVWQKRSAWVELL